MIVLAVVTAAFALGTSVLVLVFAVSQHRKIGRDLAEARRPGVRGPT